MPISDLVANAGCLGHISGRSPGRSQVATTPCGATRTTPTSPRRLETGNLAVARAQSCPTGEEYPLEGWKDEIEVMRQTGVARIRPEVRDQDRQIHVLQRAGAGHMNFSWNLILRMRS